MQYSCLISAIASSTASNWGLYAGRNFRSVMWEERSDPSHFGIRVVHDEQSGNVKSVRIHERKHTMQKELPEATGVDRSSENREAQSRSANCKHHVHSPAQLSSYILDRDAHPWLGIVCRLNPFSSKYMMRESGRAAKKAFRWAKRGYSEHMARDSLSSLFNPCYSKPFAQCEQKR